MGIGTGTQTGGPRATAGGLIGWAPGGRPPLGGLPLRVTKRMFEGVGWLDIVS